MNDLHYLLIYLDNKLLGNVTNVSMSVYSSSIEQTINEEKINTKCYLKCCKNNSIFFITH